MMPEPSTCERISTAEKRRMLELFLESEKEGREKGYRKCDSVTEPCTGEVCSLPQLSISQCPPGAKEDYAFHTHPGRLPDPNALLFNGFLSPGDMGFAWKNKVDFCVAYRDFADGVVKGKCVRYASIKREALIHSTERRDDLRTKIPELELSTEVIVDTHVDIIQELEKSADVCRFTLQEPEEIREAQRRLTEFLE